MDKFLSQVSLSPPLAASGSPAERFVLMGLHTCGDLAPSMLRVFSESERVAGLASVGCCYMKMADSSTGEEKEEEGEKRGEEGEGKGTRRAASDSVFMSRFLRAELQAGYHASYQARELACHSIAAYRDRLQGTVHTL